LFSSHDEGILIIIVCLFLVETYFKQNTEMVQNSRGNPENPVILSKVNIIIIIA